MARKPMKNPVVAEPSNPFTCDSGITSSTTTKIMAPAAKASAKGRMGRANTTTAAPMTAATGSTIAEIWPYQKLRA